MPVGIGIVGEGDLVAILQADQARHRIGTGTVHADAAIVIHGHERKRRIDLRVHDVDAQTVFGVDGLPVLNTRPAKRIDGQLQTRSANSFHVQHVSQILDVGGNEVLLVNRGVRGLGCGQRHPLDARVGSAQQLVGAILNPAGNVAFRRPAVGRVVLEAAVLGRIVRGRDDDAVRQPVLAPTVVNQNGPRDHRRRCETVRAGYECVDAVGCKNLEGRALRRWRDRMSVLTHEQRSGDVLSSPVVADGLGGRKDVGFVEGAQ